MWPRVHLSIPRVRVHARMFAISFVPVILHARAGIAARPEIGSTGRARVTAAVRKIQEPYAHGRRPRWPRCASGHAHGVRGIVQSTRRYRGLETSRIRLLHTNYAVLQPRMRECA